MKLTTEDRKALQDAINVLLGVLQQASPEVPERIEEWPEDDTHLQGDFWEDEGGDHWKYLNAVWQIWNPEKREWEDWGDSYSPGYYPPLTRTTDPSLPRTWGTLDDVPEDVERVTGDEAGTSREFGRSPLSKSGWFLWAKVGPFSGWVELLVDRTKHVTNIKETS